jgi:glutaredoxin
MNYELYTLPNCEHCEEIKNFLEERGIEYEPKGANDFRKVYREIRERVVRDEEGGLPFPVLIGRNDSGIVDVAQREEIKKLFEK